jgi:predicted MFS family arabinose efflux permease
MSLQRIVLYLASLAAFMRSFAQIIYVPAQVAMRQDLETTTSMMGLSLSVYALVFAISQIIYGPIVDRFDGKRVLLFGMGIFVVSSTALFFVNGIGSVLLLRGLQGFGIAGAVIVGLALISDVIPQDERGRAMGVFEIFNASGAAVGPVVGAALSSWFLWRADFLVLALIGLGIGLYTFWQLPAQPVHAQKVGLSDMLLILRNPTTCGATILGLVMFYGLFTVFTILPLLLVDHYGYSVGQIGVMVSLLPLGAIFGSAVGGWPSDRWRQRTISLIGSFGAFVGFGILTIISWQTSTKVPIAFIAATVATCGFLIGFSLPSQLKVMVDYFPDIRGTASGISIFARFIGATLAPVLCGYLADRFGLAAGFSSAAILFAIGFVLTLLLIFDIPKSHKIALEGDFSI